MESEWLDLCFIPLCWPLVGRADYTSVLASSIRALWTSHKRQAPNHVLHSALANELSPVLARCLPFGEDCLQGLPSQHRSNQFEFPLSTSLPHENHIGLRVRSLWPRGLNSEYPGKPADAWVKRVWRTPQQDRLEINEDEVNVKVSAWLHRLHNED